MTSASTYNDIICRSGFHTHAGAPIRSPWMTVRYLDDRDRIIGHTAKDGKMRERFHVYEDPNLNMVEGVRPTQLAVLSTAKKKATGKKVSVATLMLYYSRGCNTYNMGLSTIFSRLICSQW